MRAVLFDLDGTLWDSTEAIVPAWNRVLGARRAPLAPADMAGIMGLTDREIAGRFLPALPPEEAVALIHAAAAAEAEDLRVTGARLYPRVPETLELLAEKYALYIVSNCMDGYVDAFLHAHGLEPFFFGAAWLGHPAAGKAENIRAVCEKVRPARALYVGDTDGDGKAARAAGLPFIQALYGFGAPAERDGEIREISALPAVLADFWKD